MAEKKPVRKDPRKREGLTEEERAAMRDRVEEMKTRGGGEQDVLAKIAEMPAADRALAERLHAIVKAPCARPFPEDLVRHARLCQRRQRRLFLSECA